MFDVEKAPETPVTSSLLTEEAVNAAPASSSASVTSPELVRVSWVSVGVAFVVVSRSWSKVRVAPLPRSTVSVVTAASSISSVIEPDASKVSTVPVASSTATLPPLPTSTSSEPRLSIIAVSLLSTLTSVSPVILSRSTLTEPMLIVSTLVMVPAVTSALRVISSLEPAPPSILSPATKAAPLRTISSAPEPVSTVPEVTLLVMVTSSLPSPVLISASSSTTSMIRLSPPSPKVTVSMLVPLRVRVSSPSAAPPLMVETLARPPAPISSSISRSCDPVSSRVVAELAVMLAITFGLEPTELMVRSSTLVSSAMSASETAVTETVSSLSEPDFMVTTRSSESSSATVLWSAMSLMVAVSLPASLTVT